MAGRYAKGHSMKGRMERMNGRIYLLFHKDLNDQDFALMKASGFRLANSPLGSSHWIRHDTAPARIKAEKLLKIIG
jgi:hypothetical protein